MLLMLSACSDQSVGKFNGEPSAEILSHVDGDPVTEAALVWVEGVASDPDDDPASLSARWSLNGTEVCAGAPDGAGASSCELVIPPDSAELLFEVSDPDGAAASAKVRLDVVPLEAPVVEIHAPESGAGAYTDVAIELLGEAWDPDTDAQDLSYRWSSSVDGELAAGSVGSDGAIDDLVFLGEGNHTLTLTVTDPQGYQDDAQVAVSVGGPDTAPSCAILAPADGELVVEGDSLLLSGSVADAEEPADALAVSWESDRDGTLWSGAADSSGQTSLSAGLSLGTHVLGLRATDEVGLSCSDTVVVTVGSPPTVGIDAPADGSVYPEGEVVSLDAWVSDADDAVGDLVLSLESDVDGHLADPSPDGSGLVAWSSSSLSRGAHTLTLRVEDPAGFSASATLRVEIDGVPTAPTVSIEPASPDTEDTLVATVSGATDPDGDALSYLYRWTVDGVDAGIADASVPASDTQKGQLWELSVTATDGVAESPAATAWVSIMNSPPSLTSVTISPDPATAADSLVCSSAGFADADGDADLSSLEWSVGATVVGTGSTLSSGFSRGDVVTCTVTPFDGEDAGSPLSATVSIDNGVPVIASVAITPTDPQVDDTLGVTVSLSDPDGDPTDLRYEWYVEGLLVGDEERLAGAFAKGDEVWVTVVADDGLEEGAPMSSASVVIANSPPEAPGLRIDPEAPVAGEDELRCVVEAESPDADGDPVAYVASWTRDGAPYSGDSSDFPGDTVPAAATAAGERWTCTVTPSDPEEAGESASVSVDIAEAVVDYSGTWTLDRTVSYSCAFGLVSINFSKMTVTDTSPTVSVRVSGNPGTLSGGFTTDTEIYVDNTLTGTCNETYELAGTFTSETDFSGSFTASFSGTCFDCTGSSWIFSATR